MQSHSLSVITVNTVNNNVKLKPISNMCIVQKKIADNLLKAVQMYFNANPNANVYPLDVHISADTSIFLEDNGY